ncbi:MAG: hypothetical protein ACTSU2_09280 [Promethearchaeota archaeon]
MPATTVGLAPNQLHDRMIGYDICDNYHKNYLYEIFPQYQMEKI